MKIEKTPDVLIKLEAWKNSVSASHLVTYLYNPIDFYLNQILRTRESNEIEEELSIRNYGNLVHYAIQFLYEKFKNKVLKLEDFDVLKSMIDESLDFSIETLKHQKEFYERGMNFVHKQIAKRVIEEIVDYDFNLVKAGNSLEIIDLEKNVKAAFYLNDEKTNIINFNGYIDRIDRLNDVIRIIDYKTAKPKKLNLKVKDPSEIDTLFFNEDYKQALQLSIYKYCLQQDQDYKHKILEPGIWSFAEVKNGVNFLNITNLEDQEIELAIKTLILEILNPDIPFIEKEHIGW